MLSGGRNTGTRKQNWVGPVGLCHGSVPLSPLVTALDLGICRSLVKEQALGMSEICIKASISISQAEKQV